MNAANLQIEGLLMAMAAILSASAKTGRIDLESLDAALAAAENAASSEHRRTDLSTANRDAIVFPIRYLREALKSGQTSLSFADIAEGVGRGKQAQPNASRIG